jgi:hypothetical protein
MMASLSGSLATNILRSYIHDHVHHFTHIDVRLLPPRLAGGRSGMRPFVVGQVIRVTAILLRS